ncbi:PQQ-dependent sugar dehydrogenase [Corallococcus sicarius]|uniref:PQQ-dependent sugar dehydrogenase n=1 Tax=Corallococcus sicarius TaxID=2316726 RepID=UPI001ABF6E7A|nr:PQQ-dependent sugar dehydrogenase [Corallococcus sicarius]
MPIPIPRLRLLPLACLFAIAVACAPEPDGSESPESLDTVTSAITLPSGYSDAQVTAVGAPTSLAFTPDGRMLITTQPGAVRVFKNGALLPTPALNLSASICSNSERGVLGVAVDPQFTSNRYVYLYYTFKKSGVCTTNSADAPVNRVSRFTLADTDTISPSTELVLVDNIPSPGGNHNGGDLHFGADGLLYISVGDGGCKVGDPTRCAGQNDIARRLDVLLGKILRINKDGTIPASNPWTGIAGSRRCGDPAGVPAGTGPCRENFATGLRNPFRIAFRPGTSTFVINDVGQNVWEELDEGQAGADYGWNVREGFCANNSTTNCGSTPAGLKDPFFAYKHGSNPAPSPFQGCNSITGGSFAPAGAWAPGDDGAYFFSDYVCGKIFKLTGSAGSYTATEFGTGLGVSSAVTLRFGPSGSAQALYYTTYANGGEIRRITYTGTANRPPSAAVSATPRTGTAPLAVSFSGAGSADPDGDALTYLWTFGDGTSAQTTTATTSHSYTANGTYTASLTVRDARGASSAAVTVRIDVGNTAPVVTITSPAEGLQFRVGQALTLTGTATDAQDGTLPATRLTWTALLHHNEHTHPLLAPTPGNNLPLTAPQPEDLPAVLTNYVEIRLTATDSAGLSTTVVRNLYPRIVDVTVATQPAGLTFTVNGTTFTGPAVVKSWEGYTLNVNAPAQADAAGNWKVWSSWSDGGARAHGYVTPATASTLTATFVDGFRARVNFQPAGAAIPAGYVADTGAVHGSRGNGFTYGWNADNSLQTRERNASTDQRLDTFTHLQKAENPNASWALAVPNGSYRVTVASGDPSHFDSVFRLALEGVEVLNGTPTTDTRTFTVTAPVTVTDGQLTLTSGAGASNNKVNYIDVEQQ